MKGSDVAAVAAAAGAIAEILRLAATVGPELVAKVRTAIREVNPELLPPLGEDDPEKEVVAYQERLLAGRFKQGD